MIYQTLIAEDDSYLRTLFAKAFKSAGFQVTAAADGFAALHCIHQEMPRVIVLDVNMPGPSGLEVISFVRDRDPEHRTKIILVTGDHTAIHSEEAKLADVTLLKPVSTRELVALAKRLLDNLQHKHNVPLHVPSQPWEQWG